MECARLTGDSAAGESPAGRRRLATTPTPSHGLSSMRTAVMIGAGIWPSGLYWEEDTLAIDENTLTKGQVRKLNALRKSAGTAIREEVFGMWVAL